jgi:hypothetical protein
MQETETPGTLDPETPGTPDPEIPDPEGTDTDIPEVPPRGPTREGDGTNEASND